MEEIKRSKRWCECSSEQRARQKKCQCIKMEAHEVMKTWQYFLWWSDFVDVVLCECGCDTEQIQHFSWIFWAWNSFFCCVPASDFALFAFCCLRFFVMDSFSLSCPPPLRPIARSVAWREYSLTCFIGLGCKNSGLFYFHIANETLSCKERIRCCRRRYLFGAKIEAIEEIEPRKSR